MLSNPLSSAINSQFESLLGASNSVILESRDDIQRRIEKAKRNIRMVSTCKGKFKTADHTDDQNDLPKSTEINCAQAFLDPLGATAKYIERTLDFILEGSTIVPHAELGLHYLKQRANKMIVPQAGDKSNSKLFCGKFNGENMEIDLSEAPAVDTKTIGEMDIATT